MRPRPWSHSALETHSNCAKQYHHKYILKDLPPEVKSPEQDWGIFVHKQFEDYIDKPGHQLPVDLEIHKPYLDRLKAVGAADGNQIWAERKVAIGRNPFGPCGYFDQSVWWRGILDVTIHEPAERRARLADFKTGKAHNKWEQLAMSAVWVFLALPDVDLVMAEFYWVPTQTVTKKVWGRSELDSLIALLTPKLEDYVRSFQNDEWPMKQSGLCGWCPVTKCTFWRDRKKDRR